MNKYKLLWQAFCERENLKREKRGIKREEFYRCADRGRKYVFFYFSFNRKHKNVFKNDTINKNLEHFGKLKM